MNQFLNGKAEMAVESWDYTDFSSGFDSNLTYYLVKSVKKGSRSRPI